MFSNLSLSIRWGIFFFLVYLCSCYAPRGKRGEGVADNPRVFTLGQLLPTCLVLGIGNPCHLLDYARRDDPRN